MAYYGRLPGGADRVEALRSVQLELLRSPVYHRGGAGLTGRCLQSTP